MLPSFDPGIRAGRFGDRLYLGRISADAHNAGRGEGHRRRRERHSRENSKSETNSLHVRRPEMTIGPGERSERASFDEAACRSSDVPVNRACVIRTAPRVDSSTSRLE